jgi:flagellar motor switch protein FliN/FliY
MSSSPNSSSSSSAPASAIAAGPLAWLSDVPCRVEFILGTCTIKVRECVEFQTDSLVRLVQPAGSDLEVRVEGVPIAAGEVLVVNDSSALRVTRILPPAGVEAA